MRRRYEDEFLFTLKKHVEEFKQKVRVVIESDEEKKGFYDALKNYQSGKSVEKLVSELKPIINTPKRHPLFREVRYLVCPSDAALYTELIPAIPSEGMRTIKLRRVARETLGFNIRGGKEHGTGLFVTLVMRGCQADIVGLKPGDEILSVNGFQLLESTHEEAVNLLKTRRNLLLKVKSTGKIPRKIQDVVMWETVENKENVYYHPDLLEFLAKDADLTDEPPFVKQKEDKEVTVVVGPKGLGCSIRNGIPSVKDGLFVVSVAPGGLSEKCGIRLGDQIMTVNEMNMAKIPYPEAVSLMKSEKQLTMVLRHCKEAEDWIAAEGFRKREKNLPEFAIKTQILTKKAEEKERREKTLNQPQTLHTSNGHFVTKPADGNVTVGDPSVTVGDPRVTVGDPRVTVVNPSVTIDDPRVTVVYPSVVVGDPRATIGDPVGIRPVVTTSVEPSPYARKKAGFVENIQVISSATDGQSMESTPPSRTVSPTPLNPSNIEFADDILDGREARFLSIDKVCDLKMDLEARGGGIFVKSVEDGGCIAEHGGIHAGDQLLNVEGASFLGVSLEEAERELKEAMGRRSEVIDVVIAVSKENAKGRQYLQSGTVVYRTDTGAAREIYDTRL